MKLISYIHWLNEKFKEETDPVHDLGIGGKEIDFFEVADNIFNDVDLNDNEDSKDFLKRLDVWIKYLASMKGKKISGNFKILFKEEKKYLTIKIFEMDSYIKSGIIIVKDYNTREHYNIIPGEKYFVYNEVS